MACVCISCETWQHEIMKIMKEILYHKHRERLRLSLEMRSMNFGDYLESIPESHNLIVKLLKSLFHFSVSSEIPNLDIH